MHWEEVLSYSMKIIWNLHTRRKYRMYSIAAAAAVVVAALLLSALLLLITVVSVVVVDTVFCPYK